MNKQQLCEILECCLLAFDGVTEEDMVHEKGLNPAYVKMGISLNNFLKKKIKGWFYCWNHRTNF